MIQVTTNPADNFRSLARLNEQFLFFCEKHDLRPWLWSGTLTGWRRFGGVPVPGNTHNSYALLTEDLDRLIAGHQADPCDWVLGRGASGDGAGLNIRFRESETNIEVWLYSIDNQMLVSEGNEPGPEPGCLKAGLVFPLKETLFLGCRAFVPQQVDQLPGWLYDSDRETRGVPPGFPETFSGPAMLSLKVYTSEADVHDTQEPFILRGFDSLPNDEQHFGDLLSSEAEVYGYGRSPKDNSYLWEECTLAGREIWTLFRRGTLAINIVDSECSAPVAEVLLAAWHSRAVPVPSMIGWVLTNAPKTTFFHTDPPYGDCFMHLVRGKKIWRFIHPSDMAFLLEKYDYTYLNSLNTGDLLLLENAYLWGKLRVGLARDGDLLFFPENWPHHVRTLENSIGFGGYFETKHDSLS